MASLASLTVCTYNARSLLTEERLFEFEEELHTLKYDIIGLAEVRRRDKGAVERPSGNVFYFSGEQSRSLGGVGFYVSSAVKKLVLSFFAISPRIAFLTLDVGKRDPLAILQVYAPNSAYSDGDYEDFLDEVSDVMRLYGTKFTIVMGDFNAKLGLKQTGDSCVGNFGYGLRNERGERLSSWCEVHKLSVMNTFTKCRKARKWTWRSPTGDIKNEIDFIMTNFRGLVQKVQVVNRFQTSSDHRLVRASLTVTASKRRFRPPKTPYRRELSRDDFLLQLEANMAPTADYATLTSAIKNAQLQALHIVPAYKRISERTARLLAKRREMKRDLNAQTRIEFAELCKLIRKCVKEDNWNYNVRLVSEAVRTGRVKRAKSAAIQEKRKIVELKTATGEVLHTTTEIDAEMQRFYEDLYRSRVFVEFHNEEWEEPLPDILESEVKQVLSTLRGGTTPGWDRVLSDSLRFGVEILTRPLTSIFNNILRTRSTPPGFFDSSTVLLFKKGDPADAANYRPISLLPSVGKCFTRLLHNRVDLQLHINQPPEQAGFRKQMSTIHHIHAIKELIEKADEFNFPLFFAFVDYQKAFDSVESNAVWTALQHARIHPTIIDTLRELYATSKSELTVDGRKIPLRIERGVRQGDCLSPALFNACLQLVFQQLRWEQKGIRINGEYLSHLRFADDIVLISHNCNQLVQMLKELRLASRRVNLQINANKTKLMGNRPIQRRIAVDRVVLETVDAFIYLGHRVSMHRDSETAEVKRRLRAGWLAFLQHKPFYTCRSTPMKLKRQLFDATVLPTVLYGSETWATTRRVENRLAVEQRRMERIMAGTTLVDKRTNEWLRGVTKVKDFVDCSRKRKWRWAQTVATTETSCWTRKICEWQPSIGRRSRGRPKTRWRDEIRQFGGLQWMQAAQRDDVWLPIEEAFIHRDAR